MTRANCPSLTKPMSLGSTKASTTNWSSPGTTSTIGSPGLTMPPSVLTNTRLTMPFMGDLMSVRATLSAMAGMPCLRAASSAMVRLSSLRASERSWRTIVSLRAPSSTMAPRRRSMVTAAMSARPSCSAKERSIRTSSRRGSRPRSTRRATVARSSRPSSRLLRVARSEIFDSSSSRVF